MSIQFYLSNNIKTLKDQCIETLLTDKSHDPFIEQTIIVPNINVKKWLQLEIAKSCGVSTNVNLNYLEKGLVTLLKEVSQNTNIAYYSFLGDNDRKLDFQLLILTAINKLKDSEKSGDIQSILDYINGSNKRFWQIAEKLTFYFREYEYQRPGMIDAWFNDSLYFTSGKKIETAQKTIYAKVFGTAKDSDCLINEYSKAEHGVYTTLPGFAKSVDSCERDEKKTVYLFGLSQISQFHFNILLKLSGAYNFKIFQQNYLEIFKKYKENAWNMVDENSEESNPLIKEWCKPSMENLQIFKKSLGVTDFTTQYFENESENPSTLLALLKTKLRHEQIDHKIENEIKQDKSLQIFGAPSQRREIECIHNSIIENMRKDKTLQLTDIAVLVPNMDTYRIHIKSIFNNEQLIPYNLSDTNAGNESIFADGLIRALDIASGNFTRPDITGFLLNPCVMYSLGITRETVDEWIIIFDTMNIFYSYNENDKSEISHSKTPWYTWEYAFQRLRLGRIMGNSPDKSFHDIYPYCDIASGDSDFLDTMIDTMESLFAFFNQIRKGTLTGVQWKEKLMFFIDSYLKIPDFIKEEESVRDSAMELISGLHKFDDFMESDDVNLIFISSFIKNNLSEIPASKGKYLSDGVTISLLSPMKPIPFKVVYIAGLGEGLFPGRSDRSTLDLRNEKKEVGDITKTESDIYLFFELLLAAESKLYLSFVEKDIEKDKGLYPSTVIVQLVEYINTHILNKKEIKTKSVEPFEIFHVPLIEESLQNCITHNIINDKTDIFRMFNDKKRLARFLYSYNYLSNQEKEIVDARYNEVVKEYTINTCTPKQSPELFLSDRVLFQYLEDPSSARMRYVLGISSEQYGIEDLSIKEDEPFYNGEYDVSNIVEKMYIQKIESMVIDNKTSEQSDILINQMVDADFESQMKRGFKPDGEYATIVLDSIKKALSDRLSDVKPIEQLKKNMIPGNVFYSKELDFINGRIVPFIRYNPLSIETGDRQLSLTGKAKTVFFNGSKMTFIKVKQKDSSDFISDTKGDFKGIANYRDVFTILISYAMFLKASGEKYSCTCWFFCTDKPVVIEIDDFQKVISWFDNLVDDYIHDTDFDDMPLKFIKGNTQLYSRLFVNPEDEEQRSKVDIDFYRQFCEDLEEYCDNDRNEINELNTLSNACVPENVREKLLKRLSILQEITIGGEINE
ncbi:MAG: hypothetical protein A2015_14000 [Spirochaetes bacterium GWF1_31_7]|nr:MAG: hypothetical protein A2Y30_03750 [Spirochaetes bacterium GWE1_32_154]OHD48130.1 MAG: hypothetical protein A2Y29_10855 [Spirochaetes bacterium GWE2_31_10]OHD50515.1 MAG: hypothetical protein A2015_14000 [Spirochaetes bacterium GWF1_31_7]